MQDAARRHDENWKVPANFRAELKKDVYMYLLSPKCPSYVQSACNIMMDHCRRSHVRMHLEEEWFDDETKRAEIFSTISRTLTDRRNFVQNKLLFSMPSRAPYPAPTYTSQCMIYGCSWEKYLTSNLVVVQGKFTLKPWPFEYDLSHWVRYAFLREIMRQHSQLGDTTVTNAQGKEEKVPKEYFLYVDHCMKAAKEEH
ncbi:hypothetical protein DACRYDRAFT_25001 [Dacryopinax primogenitus]|uniref:Uncharacterized protein n=1 Tax=Dacryopinax primogenitus (strain DJM 731) TaxID=1858805 RepID=M5FQB8_DACPD|nr:uncharacterized protein DACRYDRAFT_25001 [Dacryopinax primogenitus]EJT97628.1 hypothetical protein DACRYDRAFT_25001 [Dacryopinax primogenitus]